MNPYYYAITLWVWQDIAASKGWKLVWDQTVSTEIELSEPSYGNTWGGEAASVKEWADSLLKSFSQFRGYSLQTYREVDGKWVLATENTVWR